jgi:hypothetical protein
MVSKASYPNRTFLVKLKVLKIRLNIHIGNLAPLNEPLNIKKYIYILAIYVANPEKLYDVKNMKIQDEKSHT